MQSEVKILSYNILEGLQHSHIQIDVFVDWVSAVDPDIAFYQELNGFTEEEFAALARRCGHPYSVKIKEDGYRMGISAKAQLTEVTRVTEGLRLGYIYARALDYHLFAIHFDPFKEEDRLRELEIVLAHARKLPADAKIMIVGDFNSLARSDAEAYSDPQFAVDTLWFTKDAQLAFSVTDTLLESGFSDAYKLCHSEFKRSLPTAKRVYQGDRGRRIDYAFLSPSLKDKCASAEIIHDPITRFLSDHYPLVFTLRH